MEMKNMKRCAKCILPESYPRISFNEKGVCNYCSNYKYFAPIGEDVLIRCFDKAKKKNRCYDALVPLSGGKDSTYILYLARKKYNLNILAYTFDNGFFSSIALQNIDSAVKKMNVDHIFYRPNQALLMKLYKAVLLASGELCSVCGIGITNGFNKIAADWDIPLILRGDSPVEDNSYSPENIYDIKRYKAILTDCGISELEMNGLLVCPPMGNFTKAYRIIRGVGRVVMPMRYVTKPSEDEIVNIISREADWRGIKHDGGCGLKHKHIDCVAEPLSNFIREHRFGYSRRVCQLSNLIRMGEISREQALEMLNAENPLKEPEMTDLILSKLSIPKNQLTRILEIETFKYRAHAGMLYKIVRYVYDRLKVFIRINL
jgi:hypothetical protein